MTITRARLRGLVGDGLPLPGSGGTAERWAALARLGRDDLALAKLVEPHHDAVAILTDLGRTDLLGADEVGDEHVWAVWAAEPPFAVLRATRGTRDPGGTGGTGAWTLSGSKAFCSGADLVTHALVTADVDGAAALFAVEVGGAGVTVDDDAPTWAGPGMRAARTVTLRLDDVPAEAVGAPGDYTDRPGFWHGAIGVAACWYGGALGVADLLERGRPDAHGLAHRGAVRAALHAAGAVLRDAAAFVDARPDVADERLAQAVRATVADVADTVVRRVGRATGPGPLAFDEEHARRVADLQVFVRQHHAERDLARLGELEGTEA